MKIKDWILQPNRPFRFLFLHCSLTVSLRYLFQQQIFNHYSP